MEQTKEELKREYWAKGNLDGKKELLEELNKLSSKETFTSPCGKEIDLWTWLNKKRKEISKK